MCKYTETRGTVTLDGNLTMKELLASDDADNRSLISHLNNNRTRYGFPMIQSVDLYTVSTDSKPRSPFRTFVLCRSWRNSFFTLELKAGRNRMGKLV
jgi:hypothetical protein